MLCVLRVCVFTRLRLLNPRFSRTIYARARAPLGFFQMFCFHLCPHAHKAARTHTLPIDFGRKIYGNMAAVCSRCRRCRALSSSVSQSQSQSLEESQVWVRGSLARVASALSAQNRLR